MKRLSPQLAFLLSLSAIAFYLVANGCRSEKILDKTTTKTTTQCNNTSLGNGVTCINSWGQASSGTNQTSLTITWPGTPITAGHAIVAIAYNCNSSTCNAYPSMTLSISDNINSPETCFIASPHSPFDLGPGTNADHLQQYMWVCPSIPAGVTKFTITCSTASSCNYISPFIAEFTGLPSSGNLWDADGGNYTVGNSTTSTVSTSALSYKNDLMVAVLGITHDENPTPDAPYLMLNNNAGGPWALPGNLMAGITVATAGVQTFTAHWTGADSYQVTLGAVKTLASTPASSSPGKSDR
jgi:hypothetical protein